MGLRAAKFKSEAFARVGEITEGPGYSWRLLVKNSYGWAPLCSAKNATLRKLRFCLEAFTSPTKPCACGNMCWWDESLVCFPSTNSNFLQKEIENNLTKHSILLSLLWEGSFSLHTINPVRSFHKCVYRTGNQLSLKILSSSKARRGKEYTSVWWWWFSR